MTRPSVHALLLYPLASAPLAALRACAFPPRAAAATSSFRTVLSPGAFTSAIPAAAAFPSPFRPDSALHETIRFDPNSFSHRGAITSTPVRCRWLLVTAAARGVEGGSIGGDGRDEVSSRLGRSFGRSADSSDGGSSDGSGGRSESDSDDSRNSSSSSTSSNLEEHERVELVLEVDGGSEGAAAPQEVLLKAVSEASRLEGRQSRVTNVVMGGTASEEGDDWRELDKKVNTYPCFRGFTAIGSGGDDFAAAMVAAVEAVVGGNIANWQVVTRESTKGRYISVKIGPIRMDSSEQVRAVYQSMKQDARMRYFL